MRILLVEDDESDALAVRLMLQDVATDLKWVKTIEEAQAEIAGGGYQLALVDLVLGSLRGHDVVDKLATVAQARGTRLLILTGLSEQDVSLWRAGLIRAGAETVITKDSASASNGVLVRALEEVLSRHLRDLERGPLQVSQAIRVLGDALVAELLLLKQGQEGTTIEVRNLREAVDALAARYEKSEASLTPTAPSHAFAAWRSAWSSLDTQKKAGLLTGLLVVLSGLGTVLAKWLGIELPPNLPPPAQP